MASESKADLAIRDAQADVVRSRKRMVGSVVALRTELRRTFEWRVWYRHAPLAWLGVVFIAGFLCAHQGADRKLHANTREEP